MALISKDNRDWAKPGEEEFVTWSLFKGLDEGRSKIFAQTWIDYLKTIEEIKNWNSEIGSIEHNEGRNI
jgi:hypothetical protein